jgi:hypothetical protein
MHLHTVHAAFNAYANSDADTIEATPTTIPRCSPTPEEHIFVESDASARILLALYAFENMHCSRPHRNRPSQSGPECV